MHLLHMSGVFAQNWSKKRASERIFLTASHIFINTYVEKRRKERLGHSFPKLIFWGFGCFRGLRGRRSRIGSRKLYSKHEIALFAPLSQLAL